MVIADIGHGGRVENPEAAPPAHPRDKPSDRG